MLPVPLLKSFCLSFKQHIDIPAQDKGHTLDLVCTFCFNPLCLKVRDLVVLDHCAVTFSVSLSFYQQMNKRTVSFWNINIVQPILLQDLFTSGPLPAPSATTENLVRYYNETLSLWLNYKHELLLIICPLPGSLKIYEPSRPNVDV